MALKVWNGSAFVDANLPKVNTGDVPKKAYVWNGSAYVQVWPTKILYREEFGTPNGALVSADWRTDKTPASRVVGFAAHAGVVGSNTGRQACGWHTYQGGSYGGAFLTENFYVKAQLSASYTSAATDNWTTLYLGGNDTWGTGNWAALMFSTGSGSGAGIKMIKVSGAPSGPGGSIATGGASELTTDTAAHATTTLLEFRRTYTPGTGQIELRAYINGVASGTLWWVGAGSGFGLGPTYRRWGFGHEANYPLFQQQFSSPGIEWIEAGDL